MEVNVTYNKRDEAVVIEAGETVEGLLRRLGLFPDSHIVMKGRTPIPLTDVLADGDDLKIIKVASGG